MKNVQNLLTIHSSTISAKQKSRLFAIYRDYISIARIFEQLSKNQTPKGLAAIQISHIREKDYSDIPWTLDNANIEQREIYNKFKNNDLYDDEHDQFGFINIVKTQPNDNTPELLSSTLDYSVYSYSNLLPHPIEKAITVAKKDKPIKDINFIINGKHLIQYSGSKKDKTLEELKEDENFTRALSSMLTIISLMPDDLTSIEQKQVENLNIEGLVTEFMSNYENILLTTIANLAEEGDNILKDILIKREGNNYLKKAENQGMIPSAPVFQDLLNIRHLVHHQLETLEGYGKFINRKNEQNKLVRKRYIESYNNLCKGSFNKRINSYLETKENFTELLTGLVPNCLIRQKTESNNKFLKRIKEYIQEHPSQQVYIETSYSNKEAKKDALIKSIHKLFPNVEIIDNISVDNINEFANRLSLYMKRNFYLEILQRAEHKISEHCLLYGDNCPPSQGWTKIAKQKILTKEEIEKWNKYKLLRNELSHKYLDTELVQKLQQEFTTLVDDFFELNEKINQRKPSLSLNEDNTYTAKHQNGRIVVIDFSKKKVISVTSSKGKDITKETKYSTGKRYTEEYNENMQIELKGTEIEIVTLNNGVTINLKKKRIILPNNTKIYMESKDNNYITFANTKIFTDKNFKITNYIEANKDITIQKNEVISPLNAYRISTDNNMHILIDDIKTPNNQSLSLRFSTNQTESIISFSDGTCLKICGDKCKLYHHQLELTYQNRKQFIESYFPKPPHIPSKNNTR
ncbi:MAG: hypothetical protein IJZ30_05815 [Alphaproteobacteria bacterium]|nr:hypothetical protein [Alphaproteobacteria bacterium]